MLICRSIFTLICFSLCILNPLAVLAQEPSDFFASLNKIIQAAPDNFNAIRGEEIKKDLGPFSAYANPEFQSMEKLEGALSCIITQDMLKQWSFNARFGSFADVESAGKLFKKLEAKLRSHNNYPFGSARFSSRGDALGTFFYVEPANASENQKRVNLTLSQLKGLERGDSGKLEENYQITLTVRYN